MVLRICERFGQLPSAVLAEDAATLLGLLQAEHLGGSRDDPEAGGP